MPSVEYDLRYLQAGLLDLEGYLLSNELYWPIGATAPPGDPPYPRLTLGGLLLSQARLKAQRLTPEQESEFTRLEQRMNETRSRWRTAWGQKASKGFHTRLNLWRDFIEDYRHNPGGNRDRYNYEVRRRVMMQLLQPDADEISAQELELLSTLDKYLRSVLVPGDFIWEPELAGGFPKVVYWYLYGHP